MRRAYRRIYILYPNDDETKCKTRRNNTKEVRKDKEKISNRESKRNKYKI